MILTYQCADEIVKLDIDRTNKELKVATSKTNYSFVKRPWSSLFDKGKEKLQENITNILTDEDFFEAITQQMAVYGYKRLEQNVRLG